MLAKCLLEKAEQNREVKGSKVDIQSYINVNKLINPNYENYRWIWALFLVLYPNRIE